MLLYKKLIDKVRDGIKCGRGNRKEKPWHVLIISSFSKLDFQIYDTQQKTINETQKQLDNLTQMRLKEMVDDDEYLREKTRLKNELTTLRLKIKGTEQRADDWLKLTEQTFEFACYAHKAFLFGDAQMKREILATVAHLNPTLKDHLLNIHAVEWLVPIKERYPALKAKYDAFEPALMQTEQGRNEVFASLRPDLRAWADAFQTFDWETAIPVPDLAVKQIGQLLALV